MQKLIVVLILAGVGFYFLLQYSQNPSDSSSQKNGAAATPAPIPNYSMMFGKTCNEVFAPLAKLATTDTKESLKDTTTPEIAEIISTCNQRIALNGADLAVAKYTLGAARQLQTANTARQKAREDLLKSAGTLPAGSVLENGRNTARTMEFFAAAHLRQWQEYADRTRPYFDQQTEHIADMESRLH
jgi:hypothetical protein